MRSALFREDEIPVALEVFDGAVAGSPDYIALGAEHDGRLAGWICWGPTPCTARHLRSLLDGGGSRAARRRDRHRPPRTPWSAAWPGIARLIVVETAGRPDYAGHPRVLRGARVPGGVAAFPISTPRATIRWST